LVVGGLAGIVGGWAFGQWMAKVNHFPLIAGLIHLSSREAGVGLHFVFGASSARHLACFFSVTFADTDLA
jgi:hypothetical protein